MEKVLWFLVGIIMLGVVWVILNQNDQYARLDAFVKRCETAGGVVTTVPLGWIKSRAECSVHLLNDNNI